MESRASINFPPSSPPREVSSDNASPTQPFASVKADTPAPTIKSLSAAVHRDIYAKSADVANGLLSPFKARSGAPDALASQLKSALSRARGAPVHRHTTPTADEYDYYNEDLPSSSPPQQKRKEGIQFTSAAGLGYPTPAPTSSLGRSSSPSRRNDLIASSPPLSRHQIGRKAEYTQPTFAHSRESFRVRSPLAAVFVVPLPRSGREIRLGRSSKVCDVALSSQNKLISRVHVSLEYIRGDGSDSGTLRVTCRGWNGCMVVVPEYARRVVRDMENFCETDQGAESGQKAKALGDVVVEETVSNGQTEYMLPQGQHLDIKYVHGITIDVRGERGLVELVDEPAEEETDEEPRTPLRESSYQALNMRPHMASSPSDARGSNAGKEEGREKCDSDDDLTTPPHTFTVIPNFPIQGLKKRNSTVAFESRDNENVEQQPKRVLRELSPFEPISNKNMEVPTEYAETENFNQVEIYQDNDQRALTDKNPTAVDDNPRCDLDEELDIEQDNPEAKELNSVHDSNEEGDCDISEPIEHFEESNIELLNKSSLEDSLHNDSVVESFTDSKCDDAIHVDRDDFPIGSTCDDSIRTDTMAGNSILVSQPNASVTSSELPILEHEQNTELSASSTGNSKQPSPAPTALPSTKLNVGDGAALAPTPDNHEDQLTHLVLNHLAFSRLASTPLSILRKSSPLLLSLAPEDLTVLLEQTPAAGVIERQGKDAAGKPLEREYYYVYENDDDEDRKVMVDQIKGACGATRLRSCRKVHKQYYWKRPRPVKK